VMAVCAKTAEQAAERVVPGGEMRQGGPRAVDQQRAQVSITAFADAEQFGSAAGAGLAGYQTEIGGEVSSVSQLRRAEERGAASRCCPSRPPVR
jgi:hypothetical protein